MKKTKKITKCLVALIIMILPCTTIYAAVKYYNTYETMASIHNSSYSLTEGFAVGSTYGYSAKINAAETGAMIYRTTLDTGKTIPLVNGDNGKAFATYLGHANDMDVCSLGGKSHLFITTMRTEKNNLVKLKIDGDKYYKVGQFNFKVGESLKSVSGVAIINGEKGKITFLCAIGHTYYIGSINENATTGDIKLEKKFTINVADALVDGKKISNLASFTKQGIGYYNNKLYVPLWGGGVSKNNVSVVLVYNNITKETKGSGIQADKNLSFRITSSEYATFEIEGCGIRKSTLWFNTNRSAQAAGVHYFKGYSSPIVEIKMDLGSSGNKPADGLFGVIL